jgi:hypothetical protein
MCFTHASSGRPAPCLKTASVFLLLLLSSATFAAAASTDDQIAALKAQKDQAVASVQQIVNQPVTHLKQTPDMSVSVYSPGWFHEGANTPDFNNVDVRKTQELTYQGKQYVSSDLNPGEVFLGDELEFNSMTKYFYTDRSLPKKKLTEAEMLQINDLYRVIGRCNKQLEELQNPGGETTDAQGSDGQTADAQTPETALTRAHRYVAAHKPAAEVVIGVLVAGLILMRIRRARAG